MNKEFIRRQAWRLAFVGAILAFIWTAIIQKTDLLAALSAAAALGLVPLLVIGYALAPGEGRPRLQSTPRSYVGLLWGSPPAVVYEDSFGQKNLYKPPKYHATTFLKLKKKSTRKAWNKHLWYASLAYSKRF